MKPEIKDLQKLSMKPTDVLVVRIKTSELASAERINKYIDKTKAIIEETLESSLGKNAPAVLVCSDDFEFFTITQEEAFVEMI